MRFLLMLPGLLWLLLPPICICHLPERLAGNYSEAPRPEKAPENENHAPGCPAAKKITPNFDADERLVGELPLVLADATADQTPISGISRHAFDHHLSPAPTRLFVLNCLWLL